MPTTRPRPTTVLMPTTRPRQHGRRHRQVVLLLGGIGSGNDFESIALILTLKGDDSIYHVLQYDGAKVGHPSLPCTVTYKVPQRGRPFFHGVFIIFFIPRMGRVSIWWEDCAQSEGPHG